MIPLFQNHIFEKKLQNKFDSKNIRDERAHERIDTVMRTKHQLNLTQNIDEEKLLTPNRTNFNFKGASPFLVNINCRRHRHKKCETIDTESAERQVSAITNADEVIVISDSGDDNDDVTKEHCKFVKNLFELTEENIEKHLSMVMKKKRKDSLIRLWRNKVNESRQRKSILPIDENEFEAFLSENAIDVESPSVESSYGSVATVVPVKSTLCPQYISETEDSFTTAVDRNVVENGLATGVAPESATNEASIDLKNSSEFIFQTQEVYEYFDAENNIMFYENKLLAKTMEVAPGNNAEHEVIYLNTSSESGTCTDYRLPSDYDTDDLRKELKALGDVPGPITKSTKRLYLKRLVRYKRHPQKSMQNLKQGSKCSEYNQISTDMKYQIILL